VTRPDNFSSIYLDSVTSFTYSRSTTDISPVARLLQLVDAGKLAVMISPLSLVEVRGQGRTPFDVTKEEAARSLIDHPRFLLVEFDRDVALKAREIVWRYDLKPP
jgi:hypothetical protein